MVIYHCCIRSESFPSGWQEETISLWPGTKAEIERCTAMVTHEWKLHLLVLTMNSLPMIKFSEQLMWSVNCLLKAICNIFLLIELQLSNDCRLKSNVVLLTCHSGAYVAPHL